MSFVVARTGGTKANPEFTNVNRIHKKYDDGRTKQSFKDSADINKILAKAQRVGSLSHLVKHGASYGDFSDMPDLLQANQRLQRGMEIFSELPSEVRREFDQDAGKFFAYVNDPANKDKLADLLPHLAKPGTQMPAPLRSQASPGQLEAAPQTGSTGSVAPPESPPEPAEEPASSSTT